MEKAVQISATEARRIALVAQGFGIPHPRNGVNLGHLRRPVLRLGAVKIDAVNVLVRSHYLSAYCRLGPHPPGLFDRLAYQQRSAFEYWGHVASFLPIELHPALRWRMARHANDKHWSDRWAPVPDAEHRVLIHQKCGQEAHSVPAHCGGELRRSNLRIEPGLPVLSQRLAGAH